MSRTWKPWEWAAASHVTALDNARAAATELNRLRVEREDVDLVLADRSDAERREGAG